MIAGSRTLADRWKRHCYYKIAYPDKSSAERMRLRMERIEHVRLNSYHCECCGKWHFGHTNANEGGK